MLPTRAYNRTLLSWGSMGEFDDVENYFLRDLYLSGAYQMLPTRAYNRTLLSWGSMGEFDDVENYFCTASILRDIPRAKKQIMIIVVCFHCFVLLKFVKV